MRYDRLMRACLILALALAAVVAPAQTLFKPTPEELKASYERANHYADTTRGTCLNLTLPARRGLRTTRD